MQNKNTSRRYVLKQAAASSIGVLSVPYIISSSALGKCGAVAPSNRIVMGCIGTGGMGQANMGRFMDINEVQMVAACDVDARNLNKARDLVNDKYGNKDCATYSDFRELAARKDLDAIIVATPDHWHALASIAALNAGKDVYCEKPLANSIGESRAICNAAAKNKRVLQTGSHERSGPNARFACELVRNGRIGRLHTIQINLPCTDRHHKEAMAENKKKHPPMPVPEQLDWNFWLGHAPKVPFHERRCHFWWRFILSYGGGEMTDRGAHIIDLAQLGNGTDDTGPVEIIARGSRSETGLYNVFWDYEFECAYAKGVKLVGSSRGPRGLKFIGTDGSIFIHVHGARLVADPASLLEEKIGEDEIRLGRTSSHRQNFIDAVKSRHQPMAHAEIGHRTASICHLINIAMLTGRKILWDPAEEKIVNDPEANNLLTAEMRPPWHL